jgi:hypothetical protein
MGDILRAAEIVRLSLAQSKDALARRGPTGPSEVTDSNRREGAMTGVGFAATNPDALTIKHEPRTMFAGATGPVGHTSRAIEFRRG